jgi:hypothetical protein
MHDGLPCLPSLTHLEFYLPDERNWGECGGGGGGCA